MFTGLPRFFCLNLVVLCHLVVGPSALAAQEASQSFTLDGRLYSDTAGTLPMEANPVELKLQILNNDQTCILYEETQNVNTSSTSGFFTIQVGSASGAGKRTAFYSARSMQSVYSNTVASVAGKLVSDGSNCTYNPSAGHLRYLRVLIKPPDNVTRTISPNMPITSIPSAVVAERAESVQGYSASQLLLVNTNAPISLSQTNLEDVFSTVNFAKLQDLLDGTSTQYISSSPGTLVDFNGQRLTDVATPTAATDATNKDYVDTRIGGAALDVTGVGLGVGGGSTLVWDQAANEWVAQAPGAGFEIVAGNGLLGGTLGAGDTISIDVGTTANKIVQLTNTGVLPALDGWLLTNLNAPVLSVAGRTGVVSLNAADITGLGTAATKNYGTAANNLVELTNDAALPAVDGYLLTNVNAARLRSYAIAATAPADNQILTWNNTTAVWEPRSPAVAGITDLTGDITATGPGSAVATIANSAITAAKINSTGYAINRLLITDGTNPNLVTYATCTDGEILVYGPTGWLCNSMNEANAFFQGGNAFGTVATLGTTDATNLNVITNNATRMTVTSAGNVGIGTTTPSSRLEVNGILRVADGSSIIPAIAFSSSTGSGFYGGGGNIGITVGGVNRGGFSSVFTYFGTIQPWAAGGGVLTMIRAGVPGVADSQLGALQFNSQNYAGAAIRGYTAEPFSATNQGSYLTFETKALGTTILNERMRIAVNGNVGVGTTSPNSILELTSTGTNSALIVPRDTTANRPAGNVTNGMIRYNTTDAKFEFYQAGAWVNFASASGSGSAFTQGGNAFGQVATLGTTDTTNLNIISNNATRLTVTSAGQVGIGTSNPTSRLEVTGNSSRSTAWTTNGINLTTSAATFTDTSGTGGTIASRAVNSFARPTIASSVPTTLSLASNVYIDGSAIAGASTTITYPLSLHVAGGKSAFMGPVYFGPGTGVDQPSWFTLFTNPWSETSNVTSALYWTNYNGTANNTGIVRGIESILSGSRSGTSAALRSIEGFAQHGGGTVSELTGGYFVGQLFGNNSATAVSGTRNIVQNVSTAGPITHGYGVYSDVQISAGGTITNAYGLYVDTLAGTNRWGVYQAGATDQNYFAGDVGIGVPAPTTKLQVAGVISPSADNTHDLGTSGLRFRDIYAGNATIQTSDARQKKDIERSDLGLAFINKLQPVSFRWNTGTDSSQHYGLIAQETEKVIQQFKSEADAPVSSPSGIVTRDPATDRYGIRYSELISPIIKAIQELYQSLVDIDTEVEQLKLENVNLKAAVATQAEEMQSHKDQSTRQSKELEAIKAHLCSQNPRPALCD